MTIVSTVACSTPIINFSCYYRKRAASVELPESTAWLEHLQLNLTTVINASSSTANTRVQYKVQASFTPPCCQDSELVWSVTRPFEAYRRFRKHLLRRLQPGHVCRAECKWLYAVMKNHFPKPKLFAAYSPRTTEARRQALVRMLRTLHASLVNRGNQGCKVLVRSVRMEFTKFILGENEPPSMAMADSRRSSDETTRESSASFMSKSSNDEDDTNKLSPFHETFKFRRSRGYCKSESGQ
ncbi:Phox homologous domain [Plasmopara halstedii]|uniref:Phox homologous domain n=1 Tax=Plasmopara halstedii TaxID=4781 RepID=A0A0P1AT38_PLAHL|nr:Phox homologous domain [Plasmopara halstedii]CEG44985.1 Phox homologous domain [Plasmopara halstedii]|eukprot:XP_024581354.1 Phox homologous domain [Plasmopara halstedii]